MIGNKIALVTGVPPGIGRETARPPAELNQVITENKS
jgi:NAD(P)-dependent dehydrogenase (short-subunit alcohol dehydrogenase family)